MYKIRLMLLLTLVMLPGVSWAQLPEKPGAQPFKVAFIGDTGYDPHDTPALDSNFEQVLDLVRSEEAHLLAIAGDFSYEEETDVASVYFSHINRILGEAFPRAGCRRQSRRLGSLSAVLSSAAGADGVAPDAYRGR